MNNFDGHILVVDDDEGIRNLVKQYLNENNFLVTTANSAEDAILKVDVIKFDLIVLDIMMPGKTGLEFTKENKNRINKIYEIVNLGNGKPISLMKYVRLIENELKISAKKKFLKKKKYHSGVLKF